MCGSVRVNHVDSPPDIRIHTDVFHRRDLRESLGYPLEVISIEKQDVDPSRRFPGRLSDVEEHLSQDRSAEWVEEIDHVDVWGNLVLGGVEAV
jgi:hypothetical protein